MNPQTFIFIGRSGCGKGTQVDLLRAYISEKDQEKREIFHLETGAKFREFIQGQTHTSKLSYNIYKTGAIQPSFLAVHIWSHLLIEEFKGTEHLFIDGTPRTVNEAHVLDTALRFYNREKAKVIFINVSKDWSRARLASRSMVEGRIDDAKKEDIEKRLSWFDTDVYPAVTYMNNNPLYEVYEIDGEQSIQEVYQEIISKIGV